MGTYTKDANQLLEIFPLEIWDILLCSAVDDADLENICNASPFFRKRLYQKRQLFLFRKVLPHVAPYLFRDEWEKGSGSAVLDCRVVCQTWNKSVDYHLADPKSGWNLTQSVMNYKEQCTLENAINTSFSNIYDRGENIRNFVNQFQVMQDQQKTGLSILRNPFIGRQVSITYNESADPDMTCLNAITSLFTLFGVHIWRLTILLCGRVRTANSYSALSQWLTQVSNVQFLQIETTSLSDPPLDDLLDVGICAVPKFKKLTCLKLDNLPSPLFKKIFCENNQNLVKLEIRQEIQCSDQHVQSFTNLKTLSVQLSSVDGILNVLQFASKCRLQTIKLLLRKGFYALNSADKLDKSSLGIFKVMDKCAEYWADSLENLEFIIPDPTTQHQKQSCLLESLTFRLVLPHLKTFRLEVKSSLHLDFLLGAKNSLEGITTKTFSANNPIGLEDMATNYNSETVQYLEYQNRMLESNIWSMFPKLQFINTSYNKVPLSFRRSDLAQPNIVL